MMPYLIYPYVMALCALLFIVFFGGRSKKNKQEPVNNIKETEEA